MDLMSDVFNHANLRKRVLNQHSLNESKVLKFPCDRSIGFHVVTHGNIFLLLDGRQESIHLSKGDIVVLARGINHFLSTEDNFSTKRVKGAQTLDETNREKSPNTKLTLTKVTLVSGAYQLWNEPVHPFFRDLPHLFTLKSSEIESFGHIQSALNMLSIETANPQIGSEGLIQNLLDIIFSYIVRKIIQIKSDKPKTWSYAIQNDSIKKSIELLHEHIDRTWVLEDLAKEVGLSRAGLAQKFKQHLGDTPLHYLTLIRVAKAQSLLSSTSDNLETIANAVGYSDAFSFSKVFKRVTGIAPRDFRTKDLAEKQSPFRY